MLIHAYAKINWTLNVLGERPDGYHELDMLMQSVDLCDDIEITANDGGFTLHAEGPRAHLLPEDTSRNLMLRAAKLLKQHTGCEKGADIRIVKRIPLQAGMGGGSSDAAAVLRALNEMWATGLSIDGLCALGVKLGADIPYCITGGLCRAEGLGEKLTRIDGGVRCNLLVAMPAAGLNTKEVFAASRPYPRQDTLRAAKALQECDWHWLSCFTANDLQPASEGMRSGIARCVNDMLECGAVFARMTGSGSAVYGVFPEDEINGAYEKLRKAYSDICIVHTII